MGDNLVPNGLSSGCKGFLLHVEVAEISRTFADHSGLTPVQTTLARELMKGDASAPSRRDHRGRRCGPYWPVRS
jgi:hypothetical protein